MIAFDLDGVFVPDLKWDESKHTHLLYFRHNHMYPIFTPIGEYSIITGRPFGDREETMKWIEGFFDNKPKAVYHDNNDFSLAKEYKEKVLSEHLEITMFIESDIEQVLYLRKSRLVKAEIIHFKEFVAKALGVFSESLSYIRRVEGAM
jgi:hypothetical protein